jgi:acetyltransferase-like isoleucine patch superfamily enzyme/glycosyltransferase involved in cell wall biosynthesis
MTSLAPATSDLVLIQRPQPEPRHPSADALAAELQADRMPAGDWPAARSVPVSVLIAVRNEAANIAECLRHLAWASEVAVVDSHSNDNTAALAQAMGADVYQFAMSKEGWPKKRNWALEHLAWKNEWLLIMDADEHVTPELAREIEQVVTGRHVAQPGRGGCGDGYWINRKLIFMGRWIKGCGYYPSWNVRLFKHKIGRYERIGKLGDTQSGDIEIHEHVVLSTGEPGSLKNDFLHYAYPDLSSWVEKHNRYTSWEAHVLAAGVKGQLRASPFGTHVQRRRWVKQTAHKFPFRPLMRFFYGYILRRGCLDGYPGYVICRLMAWYEFMSIAKYRELQIKARSLPPQVVGESFSAPPTSAAAKAESAAAAVHASAASVAPTAPAAQRDPDSLLDSASAVAQISPWTFREKILRALWMITRATLFRWSWHNWYRWRVFLLRSFGAQIGRRVRVRPTARVEIPWLLAIDDYTVIGDFAIIYNLGQITIGRRVTVSQYAHLCAGSHDFTRADMPLLRPPITVEDDAWIAAQSFVGPNVTVGRGALLGACGVAFKHLKPWTIYAGNPAQPIRSRPPLRVPSDDAGKAEARS